MIMLRKQVLSVNNILKCFSRLRLEQSKYGAVIYLSHSSMSKAHFLNVSEIKQALSAGYAVKTPISQLIDKDVKEKRALNEEEEAKRIREASWRTMKYTLIGFGITITCIGMYLLIELGKPKTNDVGDQVTDEFSNMPIWKQYIYRALNEIDYYKRMIREPSRNKLLPDAVKYPYFQPPYTLVLELTDVLVHPDWTYKTGWRFKKRPGIDQFLDNLNGFYEIVIYTAEQGMTVFPLIEALDPKNIIAYKLVRDTTLFVDGHHVKDLDKLNRDLDKVIVVDWNTESVKFHPENLFHVNRWNGEDDATLSDLAAFLRTIAVSEVDDVREVLKFYSKFDNPLETFREKQKTLYAQQEAEKVAKTIQGASIAKHWSPNFLRKAF